MKSVSVLGVRVRGMVVVPLIIIAKVQNPILPTFEPSEGVFWVAPEGIGSHRREAFPCATAYKGDRNSKIAEYEPRTLPSHTFTSHTRAVGGGIC